jgi:hypothetical protein
MVGGASRERERARARARSSSTDLQLARARRHRVLRLAKLALELNRSATRTLQLLSDGGEVRRRLLLALSEALPVDRHLQSSAKDVRGSESDCEQDSRVM